MNHSEMIKQRQEQMLAAMANPNHMIICVQTKHAEDGTPVPIQSSSSETQSTDDMVVLLATLRTAQDTLLKSMKQSLVASGEMTAEQFGVVVGAAIELSEAMIGMDKDNPVDCYASVIRRSDTNGR